ncbi:MAG: acyl-CoA thioesterase [Myxococcales bacterium]|nr:acyl-CoA thioesterase [Myxococcales bacterium]
MPTPVAHESTYRVPFADTDAMEIVYYGNYLKYFEIGRGELFRALGHPFTNYIAQGQYLVVVDAYAKYHAPARYDDVLRIRAWFDKLGRATCKIAYEIRREGSEAVLTTGHTSHGVVTSEGKLIRMPAELLERVKELEAGA